MVWKTGGRVECPQLGIGILPPDPVFLKSLNRNLFIGGRGYCLPMLLNIFRRFPPLFQLGVACWGFAFT